MIDSKQYITNACVNQKTRTDSCDDNINITIDLIRYVHTIEHLSVILTNFGIIMPCTHVPSMQLRASKVSLVAHLSLFYSDGRCVRVEEKQRKS